MSRLLDDEQDELPQRERELTLSTGAILAIFLGLMLLCAAFFGFGYNLGRKSTTTANASLPATTGDTQPGDTDSSTSDKFKPSPGSASTRAENPTPAAAHDVDDTEDAPKTVMATQPATSTARTARALTPTTARSAALMAPSASAPTRPAAPAIAPGGAFIVQIAAISSTHKDDADLLANALRGRGYTVAERTDAPDKLIHVQVGPFATKADAEAMRERLVVDGYNPIIK